MQNNSWDGTLGDTLDLPDTFILAENDLRQDLRIEERAIGDGADLYDSGLRSKVLTITGDVFYSTASDLRDLERSIKSFCRRPHVKARFDSSFYINLGGLRDFAWTWRRASGKKYATARLQFECGDPFWYASSLTTETGSVSGDDTITLTVSGGEPVYPVILIEPGTDLSAGFSLTNTDDDDLTWSYADPNLISPNTMTLDAERATVQRDGTNSLAYFLGELPRLLPGENNLEYVGGAMDYTITYRNRWA